MTYSSLSWTSAAVKASDTQYLSGQSVVLECVEGPCLGEGVESFVCSADIIACTIPQLSSHYTTDCSISPATSTASFLCLIPRVLFAWFRDHHSCSLRHQATGDIDVLEFKVLSRSGIAAKRQTSAKGLFLFLFFF